MTRARAADVVLLLHQEAARTGDDRYRVTAAALRQWVRRGHITRGPGGYDLREILRYLERRNTTMIKPVSITQHADGTATLLVDGKDLSKSASGLRIHIRPGEPADVEVSLDMVLLSYQGEADVVVREAEAEALVALGWTPPEVSRG